MNRRATSWPAALARGLFALVVLALLVAGVPALLLNIGTLPHTMPDIGSWQDVLSFHDDDGTVLMTVMTVIAWVLWLWLTVPVVIETFAVLARRTTPRLPGMATGQKLAGFLLGSIILASPAAAAAAPATAATAVTAQALPTQATGQPVAHGTGAEGATAAQDQRTGQVTLDQDATWWELSEQLLGDGAHFQQLKQLNPNLEPADGVLSTGTTLNVPAHTTPGATTASAQTATNAPQTQTTSAPEQDGGSDSGSYRVRAGDNLWNIAQKKLGDPTLYPEIVEANPDVIEDPDLIHPDDELTLPSQAAGTPTPREHKPAEQEKDASSGKDGATASESPRASDGEAGTPQQETSPSPSTSASSSTEDEAPTPEQTSPGEEAGVAVPSHRAPAQDPAPSGDPAKSSAPSTTEHRSSSSTAVGQEDDAAPAVTAIALTTGGFVAAGVLLMLRRKRRLQQRRRRPGRRIPMPEGAAAATEYSLRCVDAIEEISFLDAALRTLAHHCAEAERPLPAVAAVQLGTEGVLLHLLADEEEELPTPVPPFTATSDSPQVWWCPADTSDLADSEVRGQMDAPYPALVALGDDTREALLLVDLERYGAVHLTGAERLPVLRALGTSLAVSPLSADLEIAVAGEESAPGLALVDQRVTPYPTLSDAADVVRTHHGRQHTALSGSESDDLSQARAADTVDELWPMVVLADLDSCPDPDSAQQLAEVLQQEPRTATAIITSGHTPDRDAGTVWVLDTDADVQEVPGTNLVCRLVAFSDEEYADVIETALTSNSETDVAREPSSAPVTLTKDAPAATAPGEPAADAPTAASEQSGSLLARLADLDEDSPTSGPPGEGADHDAPAQEEAPPPAPAPTVRADATSPSRTTLPATTPITTVSARLPTPTTPLAAQPTESGPQAKSVPEPAAADAVPPTPPAALKPAETPMVRVLGPVDVTGARGHIESNRRTVATELVTCLALRPDGATRHELDEVIAPGGGRVENNTRNGRIREVRRWLGEDESGTPYYPKLNTQTDRKHRLVGVGCDWWQFQDLTAQAAGQDGAEARTLLRRALELVRGRPFTGIPPRRYAWAQTVTEDMISAVADAADDLAARCLAAGDAEGALWAAGRGLDAGREREVLWRHRFEALAALGAHDELEAAIQQLSQYLLEADLSMEAATEDVIRRLDAVRR
ncbi:LysM peptidoglycan-binding domain-containing protein [Streptomyces sp. BH097]